MPSPLAPVLRQIVPRVVRLLLTFIVGTLGPMLLLFATGAPTLAVLTTPFLIGCVLFSGHVWCMARDDTDTFEVKVPLQPTATAADAVQPA